MRTDVLTDRQEYGANEYRDCANASNKMEVNITKFE